MDSNESFWKEQSKRFDEAADYYDRFRPGYPDSLIECIIEETGVKPGSKVLEIGAGSGKATELFVNKGLDIFCVEPGTSLVEAGLRKFKHTDRVKYFTSRFEDWDEEHEFYDLAISAQAFHWVPKPIGFKKCSSALKPDCYMGLFWNMYLTNNEQVDLELKNLSDKYGGMLLIINNSEENEETIRYRAEEIESSGYFKKPSIYRFPWQQQYNANDYIGFLRTGNGYLSLDKENREYVENEVCKIIDRNGGYITRPYLCVLYLSQRL